MSRPVPIPAIRTALRIRLAVAIVVFLVAATLPYLWLIEHFGYDDILREPAAVILVNVHRGGSPLVLAWFAFAMASLLFIPVASGLRGLLEAHGCRDRSASTLGIASAIAQATGLLRWVLVVPALAARFAAPDTSGPAHEATLVVFDAVHRYGGMVLGEMVGQLLLAGWTATVSVQLWKSRAVPRPIAAIGAMTLPFWLLGQTELLHDVVPSIPRLELIPIAFMAWEAWLAALALALLARVWSDRREARLARKSTA